MRKLARVLWWVPACVLMVLIFRMSMDTGEESTSLSSSISAFLHLPDFVVRKAAHISEYAVLTITYSLGFYLGVRFNYKKTMIFMGICAVCYSISDEIHQRFVGGRSGCIRDVFIDSIGIVIGILLFWLISRKKERDNER